MSFALKTYKLYAVQKSGKSQGFSFWDITGALITVFFSDIRIGLIIARISTHRPKGEIWCKPLECVRAIKFTFPF